MKPLIQSVFVLTSCLFLMCNNSIETSAQTLAGNWLIEGTEMSVHFSEEGAMLLKTPSYEGRKGLYYVENGLLGIIYIDDPENQEAYKIVTHTPKTFAFNDSEGYTFQLSYQGNHEIPQDYIDLIVENFGNELGGETGLFENSGITSKNEHFTDKGDTPDNTYEEPKNVNNPLTGTWTWSGDNGTGTYEFFDNGIWKVTFNKPNGGPEVIYCKFKINENQITQEFPDGGTSSYTLNKRSEDRYEIVLAGTSRSWKFNYSGPAQMSSSDKNEIRNLLKIDQLKNPGRLFQNQSPENLSLVGCWEDEGSISDPWVFDKDGFWRTGNFDGSFDYGYEGLYNFDGKTLTVHVHSGGGLTMTVGETYVYELEKFNSSGFNFNFDGYRPRYLKTNRYSINEQPKKDIQANINKKYLEDTKWTSGDEEYLFLSPNYLILRKNGNAYHKQWYFNGNTLWIKEINDRNDDYTKIGEITQWNNKEFTTIDNRTFKAGYNVANLSTNEQTIYLNYLRLHHALFYQAMIGTGQGMGIYEVEWNY